MGHRPNTLLQLPSVHRAQVPKEVALVWLGALIRWHRGQRIPQ